MRCSFIKKMGISLMMRIYEKYMFRVLFIIAVLLVAYGTFNYFKRSKTYGTVIILNGPSASGKSSIQKEFQYIMMPNLWIKLGTMIYWRQPVEATESSEAWHHAQDYFITFSLSLG